MHYREGKGNVYWVQGSAGMKHRAVYRIVHDQSMMWCREKPKTDAFSFVFHLHQSKPSNTCSPRCHVTSTWRLERAVLARASSAAGVVLLNGFASPAWAVLPNYRRQCGDVFIGTACGAPDKARDLEMCLFRLTLLLVKRLTC